MIKTHIHTHTQSARYEPLAAVSAADSLSEDEVKQQQQRRVEEDDSNVITVGIYVHIHAA